ncbi:hypothetical protein [Nesterenkonia sp. CF4.4]|uniref:aldose epimerase family protein n=1 Tax=Nesterenkonia sp. CF4.4 TaxID=3373079 RepID=UPI003EE77898
MNATNSVSITGGGYTAEVSLLGGQLLTLTHHEDELIVPAAKTEGAFAGAVLAPWPNRTQGGSYTYAGTEHVLPINEEGTGAALHGLLTDLPLHVVSEKESEVRLAGWMESSEGYPFGLDIALTYRVSADVGLAATLMARYRPEELEKDDVLETGAPTTEQDDAAQQDQDDVAQPGIEETESGSPADAADNDTTEDADTAEDTDTGADETADDETAGEDAADGGSLHDDAAGEAADDAELDLAVSASEDRETASAEFTLADDEGHDADVADTEVAETEVADTEVAPASAPQTAPFGAGFHPYLTVGGASLTECRLRLPARTVLHTEADGAVTGRETVSQDFDLTKGPLLAGRSFDHAFTDLPEEGWTAELIHGPSGFVVRMIADSPWVQIYTGERIDRAGIAVEPMTCPPDALNSGEDLIHLVPGAWFRTGFSIEAIRPD